ncbi:zona pellucida sperm-binding protein 3-like isoform X1 [Micropterus salmoides]|uniref:zona pellucida sperm-binding protein 3-like isoform X1 n=1 Tax=Micropterus salmoides TaxID=27706 RepID=UPI0018EDE7EC|nr:zona pellucida sperm-binding protein 3-like isoform X1 [Micropterus salmoides]
MGFKDVVLLGFVLLLSGADFCAATQNWFNFSNNESLTQIPQQVTTSLQLPRSPQTTDHQSNRTQHSHPVRSPFSYWLRSYQLRNPAVGKQKTLQSPVEPSETVQAPELLKLLVQGPDLNPPIKQESKVQVFEPRAPVPSNSVAVRCGEGEITVEVNQNFLGNGQFIHPSDLTLGGCAALDTTDHILHFQTELQDCSSAKKVTEEALVYSFSLIYSPTPIVNTFILKTNPAEVVIECHYPRRHYVSSNAVKPTWKTFASSILAEQQLHFSLRLMTEDWQSQRPSSVYFLSDVMHIEVAVLQGHHVPVRVYVDSCVATVNPDPNSQPRYPFINNHGCLTDAKLTGAKSYFMQRSQEDKLHFQLKAFRFHQDHRNSLYITCHLKATTVSVPIDTQHKACSFLTEANRWVASGGDNKVCNCCETSCSEQRRRRRLAADAGLPPDQRWEGTAVLGPILLEENILQEELTELLPEPASLLQTHEVTGAALYSSIALLCGVGAALAVVLLVFMGAVIFCRLRKPTGHNVCT